MSFLREKVKEDGLAVFISSHLLYEVEEYCDKGFVINHGRLVASGQVKQLLTPYDNVVRVTFQAPVPDLDSLAREDGIERVERLSGESLEITLANRDSVWLNNVLLSRGCKVSALVRRQRTLKEFFLSIMGEKDNA